MADHGDLVDLVDGLPPGQWVTLPELEPCGAHPVFEGFAAEMAARAPVLCGHPIDSVPIWLVRDPGRLACTDCLGVALQVVELAPGLCDACAVAPAAQIVTAMLWPVAGLVALLCWSCLGRTV